MTKKSNYLIGKAEVLAKITPPPKMNPQSRDLYTVDEVVGRLKPQLNQVTKALSELSDDLCPRGYAVVNMTLHPSYIAKGHFPKKLLRYIGVRSIGSKAVDVKPDKWARKGDPQKSPSTSLFLAGKIENFVDFEKNLLTFTEDSCAVQDLMRYGALKTYLPLPN